MNKKKNCTHATLLKKLVFAYFCAAVQHERAPRSSATAASMAAMAAAAAAARSKPSSGGVFHPSVAQHIYGGGGGGAPANGSLASSATAPYHPLLYPAFFSFKPAVPAFAPPVGESFFLLPIRLLHTGGIVLFGLVVSLNGAFFHRIIGSLIILETRSVVLNSSTSG